MTISMIAAKGINNEIGINNALPWHISADLKFFKAVTMGKSVIMGRKTFESLPKALPGRKNIVVSSNPGYKPDGAFAAPDIGCALDEAESDEVFVIGGESVYRQLMPEADRLYITEVDAVCENADAFFPEINASDWFPRLIDTGEENGIFYRHVLYERVLE